MKTNYSHRTRAALSAAGLLAATAGTMIGTAPAAHAATGAVTITWMNDNDEPVGVPQVVTALEGGIGCMNLNAPPPGWAFAVVTNAVVNTPKSITVYHAPNCYTDGGLYRGSSISFLRSLETGPLDGQTILSISIPK